MEQRNTRSFRWNVERNMSGTERLKLLANKVIQRNNQRNTSGTPPVPGCSAPLEHPPERCSPPPTTESRGDSVTSTDFAVFPDPTPTVEAEFWLAGRLTFPCRIG